ncbi:hypothetical protein JYU34_004562 [Plutella xylostella]|uniref:Chitin-binding type-2 domain-containing protein n=1 Tax=Plutella xylostella TaxID=51655 RepID=A0ABQ7QYA4_PLUXY|nr:hypothetical protein JYU34_004562 [Plutella xylostella]
MYVNFSHRIMDNMEFLVLIFCVIPALVASITISPNGNSPEVKMVGGMMVDVQQGFVPMTPPEPTNNYQKSRKLNLNATTLSTNERYRRLIPYMTFYYANDLTTAEPHRAAVEVEKAEIVEAAVMRQQKKLYPSPYRNVPRYQSNRHQYHQDSAHPTKLYKDPPNYSAPTRVTPSYSSFLTDLNLEGHDFRQLVHRPGNYKQPAPFAAPTRKPYLNFYQSEDSSGVQYYIPDKDSSPKYKLVPYEQTPPVKVPTRSPPPAEDIYDVPLKSIPVPVQYRKEHVYVKPRPHRPQYHDSGYAPPARKPPSIVSENYYEKLRPQAPPHELATKPVVESGFKPIAGPAAVTTDATIYSSTESAALEYDIPKQNIQVIENDASQEATLNHRPNYYQYVVDEPQYKPAPVTTKVTLSDLLDSLQINKSIPKPITKENVGSSIRTLLQVLNTLRAVPQGGDEALAAGKPYVPEEVVVEAPVPVVKPTEAPIPNEVELHEEPYLAPVNLPSQHLDEYASAGNRGSTSQRFPLQILNDDSGGTPGRPGRDYPVLTAIPRTSFDCKTQRYKGFFADPETRCQVWHYCDLNGGQASFLCPNGTIFSQAGLTCDWWFNVRCASTTQLYVLNESLYKFILPHSPKFPEDYSGPLVDKYLTLKFKEMEEQFKKNKHKQTAAEKADSEDETSTEDDEDTTMSEEGEDKNENEESGVSESSVVVGSPGTSGNVERLEE